MSKSLSDLDEYEARMHADGRCTGCGVKVKKLYSGNYPFDCEECFRTKVRSDFDGYQKRDFGTCRASIHHELCRRMGYNPSTRGEPVKPYEHEDKP